MFENGYYHGSQQIYIGCIQKKKISDKKDDEHTKLPTGGGSDK